VDAIVWIDLKEMRQRESFLRTRFSNCSPGTESTVGQLGLPVTLVHFPEGWLQCTIIANVNLVHPMD